MDTAPDIDVVVPCYNYAHYLEACVASIVEQDGVRARVLVIDDASTDASAEVATELAARHSNVFFVSHERNLGHIATYNEGLIGWARARYSLLISADDYLAAGALRRAVGLLDREPRAHMVYGLATEFIDGHSPSKTAERDAFDFEIVPGGRFAAFLCEAGNPVPTPTVVVRTDWQQRLGGYDPALPHSGDMEMWLRFAVNGDVGFINGVQAYKRTHTMNMNHGYARQRTGDLVEQMQAIERVLDHPEHAANAQWHACLTQGRSRIADQALWSACGFFDAGDMDGAQECIRLAESILPGVTRRRSWWRLRLRRMFGLRLWSMIQRTRDTARGAGEPPTEANADSRLCERTIGAAPAAAGTCAIAS